MSLQDDYNNTVEYFARYGCSNWGEDQGNPNCSGWLLSDFDTWHKCSIHYKGQLHPDEYDSLHYEAEQTGADVNKLIREAEERSMRKFLKGREHSVPFSVEVNSEDIPF